MTLSLVLCCLALVCLPGRASAAEPCVRVHCDGGGGTVSVGGHEGGGASTGGSDNGPTGPQATVVLHHCGPRIPSEDLVNATDDNCFQALQACPLAVGATADLTVESIETITTQPDGTSAATTACDVPVANAQPQVTAADIEQWVVKQLPIGSVGTPEAKSLVNLKTVLWLDVPETREWGPLTIIQAGVRIRATLKTVRWNFGDGQTADTSDAGRPYDPNQPCDAVCTEYFGHTYRVQIASTQVRAQAFWTAEFSVDGGPFTALPAPVPALPSPPLVLTIAQARSHLVSGN